MNCPWAAWGVVRVPTGLAAVLKNSHGVEVHILPVGAIIQRLLLPDRDGR